MNTCHCQQSAASRHQQTDQKRSPCVCRTWSGDWQLITQHWTILPLRIERGTLITADPYLLSTADSFLIFWSLNHSLSSVSPPLSCVFLPPHPHPNELLGFFCSLAFLQHVSFLLCFSGFCFSSNARIAFSIYTAPSFLTGSTCLPVNGSFQCFCFF